MAAIETFEDVRGLTEPELRTLLERGRPEERVWAIWALALRSGEPAVEAETLARRTEPAPGVRRNLAVVLAGHGHYDLLVALAKRDPAPEVRAAAMQLVARIAIDGKLPAAIVSERVSAEGPEVKVAIVGTIFSTAPAWLIAIAEQLLDDRDAEVRYESFEALLRTSNHARGLMWLEEAPEAEARLALMRWSADGRARACAEALAKASRRLRRLLIESVRAAGWHELSPAIGDEPALIRAIARRTPRIFDQMPLATFVRATLREPTDAWIIMVRDRLAALPSPDESVSHLLPDFCEVCARRMADIDVLSTELRGQRDPDLRYELESLDDARVALESALEQAARMLVH